MSTDVAWAKRSHEESWRPILGLAIEEVFEIMLGCPVEPVSGEAVVVRGDFTAMVGLAGALCGVLTVCCEATTARKIANAMLGDAADSEGQVADALGEICNMITGNFKNKLAGRDERCLLSVPSVVSGGEYTLHSLADGNSIEIIVKLEECPVSVRLQLQG